MPALYRVHLSAEERHDLTALTRRGQASARTTTRAHALLLADQATPDVEIGRTLHVHPRTVQRLRRRACEAGVSAALADRPRPGAPPVLDGRQEAYLVA